MFFVSFLRDYFLWHYSAGLSGYIRVTRNGSWFIVQFFSIIPLLKTLFAPFKRVTEKRNKRFNFEDWFGTLLINLLSRLIGAMVRLCIIGIGLLVLTVYIFTSLLGFALWLGLPIFILLGVISGVIFLFI